MKVIFRTTFASLALFLVATVLASNASAQCGVTDGKTSSVSSSVERAAPLLAANRTATLQSERFDSIFAPWIVGFWRVNFIITTPTGEDVVIDAGFAQWHADGTEIMNSSKPPATSNFCLGVWERTALFTYKLNHFAISSTLNGDMVGIANIREDVILNKSGNAYTGTFSIDQFDTKGTNIMHVAGKVVATRITVDTKPAELF
jgi:hypothetical protein